ASSTFKNEHYHHNFLRIEKFPFSVGRETRLELELKVNTHGLYRPQRDKKIVKKFASFPSINGGVSHSEFIDDIPLMERRGFSEVQSNNDVYLLDFLNPLQISREHFVIEENDGEFKIIDRGSSRGILVDNKHIGGNEAGGECQLFDGSLIGLGSESTPYLFRFLFLH
ncbi:MAG: FHA domain-containing protein, partial [Gammaproteobacteria bacterium]|nr:FHA domain-containing protein [Gammaproteobacteria bacterium]